MGKSLQRLTEVLIDPVALVFVGVVILAIWALLPGKSSRWRRVLPIVLVLSGLILVASPAVVNPLVAHWEDSHPDDAACRVSDSPLVVTAGGLDSRVGSAEDFQFLSHASIVRTVEAWHLIENQNDVDYPVVLTGGGRTGVTESATMAQLLTNLGVEGARLQLEEESWSTASSGSYTKKLFEKLELSPEIRLLTSALHMKRARAAFEHAGFEVCSISVDSQAIRNIPWYALLPQTSALVKFDKLLHEIVGSLHYRVQGIH